MTLLDPAGYTLPQIVEAINQLDEWITQLAERAYQRPRVPLGSPTGSLAQLLPAVDTHAFVGGCFPTSSVPSIQSSQCSACSWGAVRLERDQLQVDLETAINERDLCRKDAESMAAVRDRLMARKVTLPTPYMQGFNDSMVTDAAGGEWYSKCDIIEAIRAAGVEIA